MMSNLKSGFRRRLTGAVLLVALLTAGAGCQTFSLTEADFQRQQRGEMVDPVTGNLVSGIGTAGYLGAVIGEAVAGRSGK